MAKQHHIAMLCLILFTCVACSKRDTVIPQTIQAVDRTTIERKKKQAIFQIAYRHASKDVREAIQPAGVLARKQAQKILHRRQEQQRGKRLLAQCAPSKDQRKILKNKQNKRVNNGFTIKGPVTPVVDSFDSLHSWYRVHQRIQGKPSLVYLDVFGDGQATSQCGLFQAHKRYQFTGQLRWTTRVPGVAINQHTNKHDPKYSYYILKVESWKELPS